MGMKLSSELFNKKIFDKLGRDKLKLTLVLPMVRVDRLYLGPMSAPDKLGRE
jgi:hypothetical protein